MIVPRKRRRPNAISVSAGGIGAGVGWENLPSDADVARLLFVDLADRRVLFNPGEWENPLHCVRSVLDLRRRLTDLIGQLPPTSTLCSDLEQLRAVCRTFCDTMDPTQQPPFLVGFPGDMHATRAALTTLRREFAEVLRDLPKRYHVTPEDHFAAFLREPLAHV